MAKNSHLTAALPGISVRAVTCIVADEGTADCALFCRCDDGSDYAIKDKSKHESTPHSEWFCTRLGERVGLASPPCAVVDVQGAKAFGSRIESGHEPNDWWLRAKAGEIDFALLAPTISRILAFDLFVHNGDRHLKNYVVRKQKLGYSILAFDYSRAWMWNGFPPPPLPFVPDAAGALANTLQGYRYLNGLFPGFLSSLDVEHVLKSLRQYPTSRIKTLIKEHPKDWLTKAQISDAIAWWDSDSRRNRIDSIEEGIANGTYL